MPDKFSEILEEFGTVDWTMRPDTVETELGEHRCWYREADDSGRPYVIIELRTPNGFFAEVEGGIWGNLIGLRYYPDGLS